MKKTNKEIKDEIRSIEKSLAEKKARTRDSTQPYDVWGIGFLEGHIVALKWVLGK